MTNELSTNLNQIETLVEETNEYSIYKTPEGKYEKRMKYSQFWSRTPETEEEMVELYSIMNEQDSELVIPFKRAIGEVLEIKHVFFNPYNSFDEETGQSTTGVTTTLETYDGKYYATSSKTVYYNLQNIFKTFGTPGTPNYLGVKVAIKSTKAKHGDQISLAVLGLASKPQAKTVN